MSLQSAIREIQRFQSSLPMRDITSAMKAIDTTTMRQIRAMDQIARAAINAFDTPEMRYLRAMERIVIAPLPSGEIAKSMAQLSKRIGDMTG